jgi:nucleotide-binding universal stress UspA family protein
VNRYAEIVVGTDGSDSATHAVRVAAQLAKGFGAPLFVVNAWTESGSEAYLAASGVTTAAAEIAEKAGVRDVRRLEPAAVGTPADALIAVAEDHPDSLLVVGGRGLDNAIERFGGNVAHQLTHHSPVDLLVARPDGPEAITSIAIATDGSATATRAVYQGVALAQAIDVVPRLLTVGKEHDEGAQVLAAIVDDLAKRGARVGTEVLIASGTRQVSSVLVEASADYDLLVIGNRGMSGPSRLLGSVSNRVTHEFATSLLLVRTVA